MGLLLGRASVEENVRDEDSKFNFRQRAFELPVGRPS